MRELGVKKEEERGGEGIPGYSLASGSIKELRTVFFLYDIF